MVQWQQRQYGSFPALGRTDCTTEGTRAELR